MSTRTNTRAGLLLAAILLAGAAGTAMAGANETPGADHKPHRFSAFSPCQWEFGQRDINIFQAWVVAHQHYTQGAVYADATNDASTGGAGIDNFFTFCTNKAADVMLVASHGWNQPSTGIAQFPPTPEGLAARDSIFNYWNGIFAAGSINKHTWLRPNGTVRSYHIRATQTFYTTYFQTPRALAWWATCWSSFLGMTGVAEARCFLGYDNVVASTKCYCDETKVLRRMDGQEGQDKRPLQAAAAGINGFCPPGGARLHTQGRLNTTLSPSVTGHAPIGIVCAQTHGFVTFDTSLETRVNPASVVQAFGDGYLTNHTWVGDDRIEFDVIPTDPCPQIFYDVFESRARSNADRARLDGNTNPQVNARGPNRDDYVWLTHCVCPVDSVPWIPYGPGEAIGPVVPGEPARIGIGIAGEAVGGGTVHATLTDALGWTPAQTQDVILTGPDDFQLVLWELPVPEGVEYGTVDDVVITCVADDFFNQIFVTVTVDGAVGFQLQDPAYGLPGELQTAGLVLENNTDAPVALSGLTVTTSAPDWTVLALDTDTWTLPEHSSTETGFVFQVPFTAPPGATAPVEIQGLIDGAPFTRVLGDLLAGVPLLVRAEEPQDFVVGNPNASIPIQIESLALTDLPLNWSCTDSNGFPCFAECPPVISPGDVLPGQIFVGLPPDPSLVGQEGLINVTAESDAGFSFETALNYVVGPSLKVVTLFTDPQLSDPLYIGSAAPQSFDLPFLLGNPLPLEQQGFAYLSLPGLTIDPPGGLPFIIPPTEPGLELQFQALVSPGTPTGLYEGELQIVTTEGGGDRGLGDQLIPVEVEVFNPVVVDVNERGISGEAGDILVLGGTLHNLRQDAPMSGNYSWTDAKGWLLSDVIEAYTLGPGERDSVSVEIELPTGVVAYADSDSVALNVDMLLDTGEGAIGNAGLWVYVLDTGGTGVDDGAPAFDDLAGIYPNPFNPTAMLRFTLARDQDITLSVHDITGRRLNVLASGRWEAGTHELRWDGRDEAARALPSGVYLVRLRTDEGVQSEKAILLR